MAFSLHVFGERLNDAGRIHRWVPQGSRQIEQVASLLALIQRPQLGPQKFVEFVAVDLAASLEPARRNAEGNLLETVDGKMLPRINLDLQPQRDRWRVLRVEPVDEGDAPLRLFPLRFAEPGSRTARSASIPGSASRTRRCATGSRRGSPGGDGSSRSGSTWWTRRAWTAGRGNGRRAIPPADALDAIAVEAVRRRYSGSRRGSSPRRGRRPSRRTSC